MTKQDILNIVATHLFTQGVASYGDYKRVDDFDGASYKQTGCLYRGPNGTMCAVGCLLPDEVYQPKFEGRTAGWVAEDITCKLDYTPDWAAHPDLLGQLQGAHDQYMPRPPGYEYAPDEPDIEHSLANVAKELKRIGDLHGLALPTIVETFLA